MKKSSIFCTLALSLALFSCTQNTESTIIFPDNQRIPDINTYMPMDLLEAFTNENLNFGDNPPDLRYQFKADSLMVIYADAFSSTGESLYDTTTDFGYAFAYYHNLYYQHMGLGEYDFTIKEDDGYGGYLITSSDSVYIMGEDPYFTAFFYETRNNPPKTEPRHAVIISGEVTPNGIKNYVYGYQVMGYGNLTPLWEPRFPKEGSIIIIKDSDGLAEYDNWLQE